MPKVLAIGGNAGTFESAATKHTHVKLEKGYRLLVGDLLVINSLPKPTAKRIFNGPHCLHRQAQNEFLNKEVKSVSCSKSCKQLG